MQQTSAEPCHCRGGCVSRLPPTGPWCKASPSDSFLSARICVISDPNKLQRAKEPRGIAGVDARCGDILGNNGSRAHYDVVADLDGKNCHVRADADMVSDAGRTPKVLSSLRGAASGEEIVDEHRSMGDEAIVSDCDELADKGVGLNPAPLTDHDAALNLDKGTDKAIVPNCATIKIDRLDDGNPAAKGHINYTRLSNRGFCRDVFDKETSEADPVRRLRRCAPIWHLMPSSIGLIPRDLWIPREACAIHTVAGGGKQAGRHLKRLGLFQDGDDIPCVRYACDRLLPAAQAVNEGFGLRS
jgi:hypothetical protein